MQVVVLGPALSVSLEPGLHQARVSPSSAASAAKSLVPAAKPRCGPSAFDLVKKLKQARVGGHPTCMAIIVKWPLPIFAMGFD